MRKAQSKHNVDARKTRSTCYFAWDSILKGFGIRIIPLRTKTFQEQYWKVKRTREASPRRHGVITGDQARASALTIVRQTAEGYGPVEAIALERVAPTISDLCDRCTQLHVHVHAKPNTTRDFRPAICKMIPPCPRHIQSERSPTKRYREPALPSPCDANPSQSNAYCLVEDVQHGGTLELASGRDQSVPLRSETSRKQT